MEAEGKEVIFICWIGEEERKDGPEEKGPIYPIEQINKKAKADLGIN